MEVPNSPTQSFYTQKFKDNYEYHVKLVDKMVTKKPTQSVIHSDPITGEPIKDGYGQYVTTSEPILSATSLREMRRNAPFWNTLKEVFWLSHVPFTKASQFTGKIFGYIVTAVVVAPIGVGIGIGVATVMSVGDKLGRLKNNRTFDDWVIKTTQVVCDKFLNRATEFLCTTFCGISIASVRNVLPLMGIVTTAGVLLASPFIYVACKKNSAWLEKMDKVLMTNQSMKLDQYVRGPFMDFSSKKLRDRVIYPVFNMVNKINEKLNCSFLLKHCHLPTAEKAMA